MPLNIRRRLKASSFLVGIIVAIRGIPLDFKVLAWTLRRRKQISNYLECPNAKKLQIGTGQNRLEGWLNSDLRPLDRSTVYLDAAERFPFPDATFDYIFSEHVIEHLPFESGNMMLGECYRVLQPGGRIRLATPNLERIACLISNRKGCEESVYIDRASSRYIPSNRSRLAARVVNNFFWDFGHTFVYDPPALIECLQEGGFTDVKQVQPNQSDDPNLSACEQHGEIIGDEMNRYETMIFEATKNGDH